MSTSDISLTTINPTYVAAAEAEIDDVSTSGLVNPGYENVLPDPSHHYEDPSHLKTSTGSQHRQNPIYESATPRPTKYEQEPVESYKESRIHFVILFVILVICVVALILVILIILGQLGPGCSCNQPASKPNTARLEDRTTISLKPVYNEIYSLTQNLSTMSSQLNQQISSLQRELIEAKRQIQFLQRNTNAVDIAALWVLANSTKDELQSEAGRLQKDINESSGKCNDGIASLTKRIQTQEIKEQNDMTKLQKNINDTMDKCNAGDAQLTKRIQTQETKEQNDVTTLQKNINDTIDKCNAGDARLTSRIQTQETKEQNDVTTLRKAIDDSINKCKNVNSTLSARIDTVSKIPGPRGYNGSQGPQGPQGPPGAGNLTQCIVKREKGSIVMGSSKIASSSVSIVEPQGKKIVHYSCSSNNADVVEQDQPRLESGKNKYVCGCSGQGTKFDKSTDNIECYMTYTECPLIT